MSWETVIGLEVHVQLNTKSKIFSGASTTFGANPNVQACPVDLGLPGVLPVLNQEVVRLAVKFGLGINAHINKTSVFERKNYFYPDSPKGYQISQLELPIVGLGELAIEKENGETTVIGVTRAHLEEDAGKSIHDRFPGQSGIDLNRAGTPLLEIVSEPELRNAKDAVAYMKALHAIIRYLDISDGDMSQGSMRCDANVSIRPKGQEEFGTRTEIKNINSFKFVEKAINIEVERQIDVIESGGRIVQETRLYDSVKNETRSMRSKEEANDYRYFPDPDLLPIVIDDEYIEEIRQHLPELPKAKKARFIAEYQLSDYDASLLSGERELAHYFESVVERTKEPKLAANWLTSEVAAQLNKEGLNIAESPVSAEMLSELISRITDNTISGKIAKTVFQAMWQGEGGADAIIEIKGLKTESDSGVIEKMIDEVIANNPDQVAGYKSGKDKLFGFFVGQVMKASKGKADPKQVNDILKQKLSD